MQFFEPAFAKLLIAAGLIEFNNDVRNFGVKVSRRIVECEVTIFAYANQRHINLDQLDNACRDLTELYLRLDLPKIWGEGKKVAADGTQYDFYDQNLDRKSTRLNSSHT